MNADWPLFADLLASGPGGHDFRGHFGRVRVCVGGHTPESAAVPIRWSGTVGFRSESVGSCKRCVRLPPV